MIVPFQRASIGKDEIDAVVKVLNSGWITTGSVASAFEADFATFLNAGSAEGAGAVKCLAVNSNTSGMTLALEALGAGEGAVVVCPVYTFTSTPLSAVHLGAAVIFCDTEKNGYNMDLNMLEAILKRDKAGANKVRVIIPTHIAGLPMDMKRVKALAAKYSVRVIEDCAHSFPSLTKAGFAGTLGDIGVFSFYATKTITTGEGGMVAARDEALIARMRSMRLHGMDRAAYDRYTSERASWVYDIKAPGFKFNLPDILAALGVEQLKKANALRDKRRAIVARYNEAFSKIDAVTLPPDGEGNSYHLYLLRLKDAKRRDDVARSLQKLGLGISVHFIPMCNFTFWKEKYALSARDFPNAVAMYDATISLPLWPDMTSEMVDYVIDCVKQVAG